MKNYCSMPECDVELTEHAKSEFCKNCRGSMGTWRKRPLKEILGRRARLKKYDSRMGIIEGERSKK